MAKKDRSFAAKMAKSTQKMGINCPTCGNLIQRVLYVTSERSPQTGAWKFNEKYVGVCKCNEKELYG